MIIGGGSRSNWRWFSKHLMNGRDNELVRVAEIRGLPAGNLLDAFREMQLIASVSPQCKNFFYHADINPREEESLTEREWDQAIDILERNLGLEGQSRVVIEHDKNGRVHRHVVWSRIDPDTMRAVPDSNNYDIHMRTADKLEELFGHERTDRGRGADGPNPENWEVFRGKKSRIDPYAVKAELTQLWRQSDTGQAFAAALAERGFILAKGDRRDFVVIDQAGDDHSLPRRVGAKAAEVRARMAGVDRESLPSVEEARELARSRRVDRDGPEEARPDPQPERPSPDKSRHSAVGDSPQPDIEYDRTLRLWREAYRAAIGDGLFIAEGIDWLAGKIKRVFSGAPPADQALTPFERTMQEMMEAARENGGEPVTLDGMSFWQRAVALMADARGRAMSWIKDRIGGFAQRYLPEPDAARDEQGMER
jgi:hypothetical protein